MMWVLWVGLLSFLTKFQWTYTPRFDCHNFYKWSNRAFRQFVNHCLFNLKFHIRICEIFIIMYLGTRPVSESIQWDFFFFFLMLYPRTGFSLRAKYGHDHSQTKKWISCLGMPLKNPNIFGNCLQIHIVTLHKASANAVMLKCIYCD